ncbi:MAG: cytochrome c3 family protein [Chloroflexi bacterium]|nr:cytochrome c3 family protein [Chloroflexota bacterium]
MPRPFVLAALAAALFIVVGVGGLAYGLSLEEHNDFCASCHTEPETTYVSRFVKTPAVDLASVHAAKNVKCIDCHGGAPPLDRVGGLVQGAHDYALFITGNYHHPAITTNPLSDVNCVKCHSNLFQSRAIQNHYHFYLPAWQKALGNKAAGCVNCHHSHSTEDGHIVKFVADTKINPICQACHEFQGIK